MSDQADKLRLLAGKEAEGEKRADGRLPLVTVSGARAGVGTTTVALNLAAVLADRGSQVLLVDAASHRADADESIAARRDIEFGLEDIFAGKCGLQDAIVTGAGGLQMLLQRRGVRGGLDATRQAQERFMSSLRSLEERFELIIVDAGRGLTTWSQRYWSQGKLIVLVSTPDDEAVLDAYTAIKQSTANGDQLPVRLLVNQADSIAAAERAHRRIDKSCQRFLSCSVPALPALLRYEATGGIARKPPRVWEMPNTPFGHAALWLGRAVADLVEHEPRGKRGDASEWRVSA
ncbi:MAG TPA: AAA family ATPase [Lacipirellulaceae bacterium]|jgi:flagellar biosynthesis protein FlhG|nr:AAA family ATPase [Lacipirellulaceae bacterium]